MSAPRKSLKERFLATPEEPPVVIQPVDPAEARSKSAKEGWMAIEQLVKERNEATKRVDTLDRRVDFLLHANNNERAKADYERARADHSLQLVAQLGVIATTLCNQANELYQLLAQNAALVQRQPAPPKITNNPDLPAVIDETPQEPQFDQNGVPYNAATVSDEHIQQMIAKLQPIPEGHA